MLATDMTASGSPEEKLRWAFKMYDKDGSGQKPAVFKSFLSFRFLLIDSCLAGLSCNCLLGRFNRAEGDDGNNWDSLSDGGSRKGAESCLSS